jgi:polysaccharide biosynthesis transport protein
MGIIRYPMNQSDGLPEFPARTGDGTHLEPIPYAEPIPYIRVSGPQQDSLGHYWKLICRRKGTLIASTILGLGAGLLFSKLTTPVYRAETSVEVQSMNEDFLNMKSVTPTAPMQTYQFPEYNIRTQTAILQSRPVVERAMSKLGLEQRLLDAAREHPGMTAKFREQILKEQNPATRNSALAMAIDSVKIKPQPTTRVIDITFDSTDPKLAADFANSITESFIELNLEKRLEISQKTTEWLTKQMQEVKVKLKASEDELQRFARQSNLVFLSEKDNVAEERLRQLQTELTKAQTERQSRQSRYELVSSAQTETLPEVLDDQALKEYQKELTDLRRQLAELSSMYTPEHPKVEKLQAQIATLQTALDKKRANIVARIKNEFDTSRRRETLLSNEYASQTGVMSRQADKISQYVTLKREVDTTRQLYDSMFQKAKEAGMASSMRASDIHVVEPAIPPPLPYKPNTLLNTAFGLFSGLCAGLGWVLAGTRSDHKIQEPGDIAFHLNVPELGVVPSSTAKICQPAGLLTSGSTNGTGRLELTSWNQRLSTLAESYRVILTSILFSDANGAVPRVIVLTSANPGEGKTTVTSNLAIALAQANRRVLLVDGDMRKPRLHDIFDLDNSVGFSDALAGKAALSIQETKIPNLSVLTSGQSADTSLLFTPQVRQMLRRLRDGFDTILIDTPPMLQMPDARILGKYADAMVLVVAQNTLKDSLTVARQRLAEDGSHLLGTILNNWNPKKSHSDSGYSDYFKQYYGKQQ